MEWLYALLKPRVHNRIALAVVFCGVAQFLTPFWLPIVEAFVREYFGVESISIPEHPIYGIVLAGLGLTYHYLVMHLELGRSHADSIIENENNNKNIEHDKKLAIKIRASFPIKVRNSMYFHMYNNHLYESYHSDGLHDFMHMAGDSEFVFLLQPLESQLEVVLRRAAVLSEFMALKFWIWPEGQRGEDGFRFALWPWGNVDRAGTGEIEQMKKYNEMGTEMERLLTEFRTSFDELIRLFHTELHLTESDI